MCIHARHAMGHLLSGQVCACTLLGCTRLKNALHGATLSSDEIRSTGHRQQIEKRIKLENLISG